MLRPSSRLPEPEQGKNDIGQHHDGQHAPELHFAGAMQGRAQRDKRHDEHEPQRYELFQTSHPDSLV